jgi:hypothetical protein
VSAVSQCMSGSVSAVSQCMSGSVSAVNIVFWT